MDIQLFIVIIIGVVIGIILLKHVYKFFFTTRKNTFCSGCSGCDISEEFGKKLLR